MNTRTMYELSKYVRRCMYTCMYVWEGCVNLQSNRSNVDIESASSQEPPWPAYPVSVNFVTCLSREI